MSGGQIVLINNVIIGDILTRLNKKDIFLKTAVVYDGTVCKRHYHDSVVSTTCYDRTFYYDHTYYDRK